MWVFLTVQSVWSDFFIQSLHKDRYRKMNVFLFINVYASVLFHTLSEVGRHSEKTIPDLKIWFFPYIFQVECDTFPHSSTIDMAAVHHMKCASSLVFCHSP